MSHVNPHISNQIKVRENRVKSVSYYVDGILHKRDDFILSEAITLLESNQSTHKEVAFQVLSECFQNRNTSCIRVGVTGSPGVGKSTFIEYLGKKTISEGKRIAVLTVDPSSQEKKGSILGDKTRMNDLHNYDSVFIRPSPSSTYLGGLHRYTSEAIWLCEAAGYDMVIVETVGVGQSEIEISDITDYNLLLVAPTAGDSLQGVKMGIMEVADMIIIHKADGIGLSLAQDQQNAIMDALHTLHRNVPVVLHSSLRPNDGESMLTRFHELVKDQPKQENRKKQYQKWLRKRIHQHIVEAVSEQIEGDNSNLKIDVELSKTPIQTYLALLNNLSISVKFAG